MFKKNYIKVKVGIIIVSIRWCIAVSVMKTFCRFVRALVFKLHACISCRYFLLMYYFHICRCRSIEEQPAGSMCIMIKCQYLSVWEHIEGHSEMKALSRSSAFSNLIISLAVTSDSFSGSRWSPFLCFCVVCVCRCCSPVLLFPTKEAVKWDDERNEAAEGLNCCHGVTSKLYHRESAQLADYFLFFGLSCPESLH